MRKVQDLMHPGLQLMRKAELHSHPEIIHMQKVPAVLLPDTLLMRKGTIQPQAEIIHTLRAGTHPHPDNMDMRKDLERLPVETYHTPKEQALHLAHWHMLKALALLLQVITDLMQKGLVHRLPGIILTLKAAGAEPQGLQRMLKVPEPRRTGTIPIRRVQAQ